MDRIRRVRADQFGDNNAFFSMAGGFAKDGTVQDQIDATVEDAVKHARDQLPGKTEMVTKRLLGLASLVFVLMPTIALPGKATALKEIMTAR